MIIAFSIPGFVALIGLELLASKIMGRKVYRFADAISDLSCGISSQLVGLLLRVAGFGVYMAVYESSRLLDWGNDSIAMWVIAILGVDLLYYWWHRHSHVVNVLWAAHVVHHQSEDYNLAVALRQAWFTGVTQSFYYLPLALLGVTPLAFAVSIGVSLLYQFWIHTRLIGKLPRPLEWLLNTPSHHRVHHGINPEYLDKNYAAIFMLWDRMFGTFEPEVAEVKYGITKPLNSFDPAWANLHYLAEIGEMSWKAPRLADKLWAWVAHPAWYPRGLTRPKARNQLDGLPKYEVQYTKAHAMYVGYQMAMTIPVVMGLLIWHERLEFWALAAIVITYVVGLSAWAGMLSGRKVAGWTAEIVRSSALVLVLVDQWPTLMP